MNVRQRVHPGCQGQEKPGAVLQALIDFELLDAYERRPLQQRRSYLEWIGRARKPETRRARIARMLAELEEGLRYTNIAQGGQPARLERHNETPIPTFDGCNPGAGRPMLGVTRTRGATQ